MTRELKSASEIQAEVQRLIDADRDVIADGKQVKVSRPMPYQQPDETGCNWNIEIARNSVGHTGTVRRAIDTVRQKWNLK
jgi:hypothetical protein